MEAYYSTSYIHTIICLINPILTKHLSSLIKFSKIMDKDEMDILGKLLWLLFGYFLTLHF